ncbi:MAG TPA: FAD-dependent oxidoreductase [Burkholderiales bacterium]|nr:FAD-dependent oxidoreductase [Burkholderiales bacterium]
MSERLCDVAIVGGGPIGAALALALTGSGLCVTVLEARADAGGGNDARTLAMSYGSRLLLERLRVWDRIASATPITSIHVSQRGGFGRTMLDAPDAQLPALGYVVRYADLQRAIVDTLIRENVDLIAGAEMTDMNPSPERVAIEFRQHESSQRLCARLLVIADGGGAAAERAGAGIKVSDYGQHAVVGLVSTSRFHAQRAYERFTPNGPMALLPFEDRYALVWTAKPAAADRLMAIAPDEFLRDLQHDFGDRAGRFTSIESRARFPLTLRYAEDPVMNRIVMLGNAAQALHPIAGQGFNLGLRDAWELGEILVRHAGEDPGGVRALSRYRSMRRPDRVRGIALTHSLVKIFSNDFGPLRAARGAALALLDLLPPMRRAFTQRMIFGVSRR